MTYREFCILTGYMDDGTRKQTNVVHRCAYVHAFRNLYTLTQIGDMMKKTHATIIHYMTLEFKRNEEYHRILELAKSCLKYEQVDSEPVSFDKLLEERNELRKILSQKSTQISLLQEELVSLREKIEKMKAVVT